MKRLPKITEQPSKELRWKAPEAGAPGCDLKSGRSVHVLESDQEELVFLCDFLSFSGLRVSGSTDPERALRFVERRRPDVLICNLATSEMGGDKLLEGMWKACPATRVILISNWPNQPVVEHGREGSDVDLLIGPFNAISLLRALERILGKARPGNLNA